VVLVGPSGCGKSTTLRAVAGLEKIDAGDILIGGKRVNDISPQRRDVAFVFQNYALYPHMTVAENMGFGLRMRRVSSREIKERVAETGRSLGLEPLLERYPMQLSGGERQRVALARALANAPDIVLLDEPFSSIDVELRTSMRREVVDVLRRAETTAILVTHDQDEALSTADRVAVLRDGGIAQCDAPQELYSHPVDADMARFIGEANLIPGILNGSSVQTLLGVLAVTGADAGGDGPVADAARNGSEGPGHRPAMVLIRPEQVELVPGTLAEAGAAGAVSAETGPAGPASSTGLTGRITGYGYHGHDAVVTVQPEQDPQAPPLTVRTLGGQALSPGSKVTLRAHGPVIAWPQRAD
jgi:ABC-type sugar transport system ATPase subunit